MLRSFEGVFSVAVMSSANSLPLRRSQRKVTKTPDLSLATTEKRPRTNRSEKMAFSKLKDTEEVQVGQVGRSGSEGSKRNLKKPRKKEASSEIGSLTSSSTNLNEETGIKS